VVPGGVFVLREGDKISSDARIVECFNLKVNHSALTGESEPQLRSLKATHKDPLLSRNMVFSGTLVQNGSGKAVVVATGDNTQIGKIAKLTTDVQNKTSHMQKELGHFIKIISAIAIILGILFFIMGVAVQYHQTGHLYTALLLNLVFAIGIIVANVPEGLLPTVTLTLSIAAQKMAKNNALVKNMDSIETLGSLTVICSDKTGTLTENKLNVHAFYLNNQMYMFDHKTEKITLNGKQIHIHNLKGGQHMKDALLSCNNSNYNAKTEESSGDPTEICLKQFISTFSNIDYISKEMPRIYEIPFESGKKYMITANQMGDDHRSAFLKGAPEDVLKKCS
jgi:sodium/potassium-transporting ATPase subunit alpha